MKMDINNLIMTNMMYNNINNIKTGYNLLDEFLKVLFFILIYSSQIQKSTSSIFSFINIKKNKTNSIEFSSCASLSSNRYRALMYYIANNCDAKRLSEIIELRYNSKTYSHDNFSVGYSINDIEIFNITHSNLLIVYYLKISLHITPSY
jgi:hypothetical protein